jgi:hypothetical protein
MPAEVILATGHMVDLPDRSEPRFPPAEVPRVTAEIGRTLDEWGVDASTVLVCGGARGADILAAEGVLERGGAVIVCLPLPPDRFVAESVELPGDPTWTERFHALVEQVEVRPPPEAGAHSPSGDVFTRNNSRMIELAAALGDGSPRVLAVWDGREGDGPGGTADVVNAFAPAQPDGVRIIDPTPR